MQAKKSTLALKPRADVTRSHQSISGPTKKTDVLQKILKKGRGKNDKSFKEQMFQDISEI